MRQMPRSVGLGVACLLGCGGRPPEPAPAPAAAPPAPILRMTQAALGPLTATSAATLASLRQTLAGFEVTPINDRGLEFRVSKDGEKLFDVIPDVDGSLLNVHVVSPKVEIVGRPWQVGAPFAQPELLTTCECWGDQPVCFKDGEHIAVAFARTCEEGSFATAAARRQLAGVPVKLAIWSPRPLVPGGAGGDAYGDGAAP